MNAYFDTEFECIDPDVYYEILLIDEAYSTICYTSKNRYAVIEDFINSFRNFFFFIYNIDTMDIFRFYQ